VDARLTLPEPGNASRRVARRTSVWLALGLLAIDPAGAVRAQAAAPEQPAAQAPIAAVWKKAEILFSYQSSIAIYSCDSLRDRVASILYAVGARPDLKIRVTGCSEAVVPIASPAMDPTRRAWGTGSRSSYPPPRGEIQQDSTVHVLLSMPAEMTPDVVEELKADKSRRELISRVTGNPIHRFDDPIPFAAERRVVTISHKTVGIEAVECQLLDRLVTSSFKDLGLRVVRRNHSCDRYEVSMIRPTLQVEALLPVEAKPRETEEVLEEPGDETGSEPPAVSEPTAGPGDEAAEPDVDQPPE
jgi:hypothetical protein